MADDLPAPRPGWFSLTVLSTVHETCRMCDVVMDTLKKITPSRFSTLPTLCWTEKGILTSPRIISKPSCFSIWGSYIFQHPFFFVIGNPARELCLLLPRNDRNAVSVHFFQTFQEKEEKPLHLNISLRLRIVPVPHWTIYCCWPGQQGGVVLGVTVLQPEDLDSISHDSWNPPCWGALWIHNSKDAAL